MLNLTLLELRKLQALRSVRLAVIVCLLFPWLWSFAPRLQEIHGLILTSAWQVPSLTLLTAVQFLIPIFVAVTAAELIGSEVSMGTLAPMLLRPISRTRLLGAKLLAALIYPAILLTVLLIASLLAGARFGFGEFYGGVGLGASGFVGTGLVTPTAATLEILRGYALAATTLIPISALALLFAVYFMNTAASALATIAVILLMRLLNVFSEKIELLLLTTHLGVYLPGGTVPLPQSLLLLAIYTAAFSLIALFSFERRDV